MLKLVLISGLLSDWNRIRN